MRRFGNPRNSRRLKYPKNRGFVGRLSKTESGTIPSPQRSWKLDVMANSIWCELEENSCWQNTQVWRRRSCEILRDKAVGRLHELGSKRANRGTVPHTGPSWRWLVRWQLCHSKWLPTDYRLKKDLQSNPSEGRIITEEKLFLKTRNRHKWQDKHGVHGLVSNLRH
jgi:hypothetical protein